MITEPRRPFVFRAVCGRICALALVLMFAASLQTARAQEKTEKQLGESKPGEAVFEIPKGYMKAKFAELRGVLIIDPKKPGGMFVSYPDDNETIASLRQRIRTKVTGMFVHGDKNPELAWDARPLPSHKGDGDGKASLETATAGDMELQFVTYERTTGAPFLYGYFAMRHKSGKGDNGRFIDEQGKGVKAFDELWQSMPGSK
jgi:hypothetical protein